MQIQAFQQQTPLRTLNKLPDKPPLSGDQFQPREPDGPTPLWKKMANAAVVGAGTAVVATVAGTVALAATISGPDALGAPLLAAAIGGPVGFITGAIAGWKNCDQDNPSLLRKLGNASAWAAAGAVAGVVGTVALVGATVSGPDALGGLLLAPAGAALGAAGGGVLGWKIAQK